MSEQRLELSDIATQNSSIEGKNDADIFWVVQGPILEQYQERSTSGNSVRYSETLRYQLKQLFKPNSEKYCRNLWQCFTIMPVSTLQPMLLKASVNSPQLVPVYFTKISNEKPPCHW
jgi:hypothetical protein